MGKKGCGLDLRDQRGTNPSRGRLRRSADRTRHNFSWEPAAIL